MTGPLDSTFTILRTTIESALEAPLAVTITSAQRSDGKTRVAAGLARAFSIAEYRTIVIDANPESPAIAEALGISQLRAPASLDEGAAFTPIKVTPFLDAASIADESLTDASSSVALRAFMESLRGQYAVTIWDAGDAFTSSLALQCASASDGTIVAVRYGRNPTTEDERLVETLEQVGGRIIGIVPTEFPAERKKGFSFGSVLPKRDREVTASGVRRAGKSTA